MLLTAVCDTVVSTELKGVATKVEAPRQKMTVSWLTIRYGEDCEAGDAGDWMTNCRAQDFFYDLKC